MGPGPANHLQELLEHASGPLADPYQTGHGHPLGSPVKQLTGNTMFGALRGQHGAFPPSSLLKGDEGAYNESRDNP
jgi:hypothetical protein